ncbi:hypothetical protein LR48_Vigan04g092800 [Vigna angularis]|uniref:Uncharacterized protein n=1 Tax=Phaseolus angularis TaxID=3914 RepID=A0A0L9UCS1_PHAAN|nr:hypothetical protein LR48_Vigan04g092800 [Vigna angularis]
MQGKAGKKKESLCLNDDIINVSLNSRILLTRKTNFLLSPAKLQAMKIPCDDNLLVKNEIIWKVGMKGHGDGAPSQVEEDQAQMTKKIEKEREKEEGHPRLEQPKWPPLATFLQELAQPLLEKPKHFILHHSTHQNREPSIFIHHHFAIYHQNREHLEYMALLLLDLACPS